MKTFPYRSAILTLGLAALALVAALPVAAQGGNEYKVTITNVTKSQIISPPLVVSHSAGIRLFSAGRPALPELAVLAEDGDPGALDTLLSTLPEVLDTEAASGPVLPGESVTLTVQTQFPHVRISAVGMLISTNDAFFGLNGVGLPERRQAQTHSAVIYDAGTESNSELCAFIPGPPCGNGGVRDTDLAEGFVYIHSGIHGIGDLEPSVWDWRNPGVRVTIQRTR